MRSRFHRILFLSRPQINRPEHSLQPDLTRMGNSRRVANLAEAWYS
jgi:hypothetical protein